MLSEPMREVCGRTGGHRSAERVHVARNQVVTLYLFIFVPLSMAWIYYYYRGFADAMTVPMFGDCSG